jgi:HJR/Mrr/RecB family endonuclease
MLGSRGLVPVTRAHSLSQSIASPQRQRGSCGIIGSTMWKRFLAAIFALFGLVVWKRFLDEDSEDQSAAQDTLARALQATWAKSSSMSGREFEHFMADLFRTAGYKVDVVGGAGDQGVDLLLNEGRKRIAVQCKKYGKPVGNAAVSAIYAGAKHYGAKQAWVVAPEGFTKGAIELAKSTGVRLIGRKGIDGLLRNQ